MDYTETSNETEYLEYRRGRNLSDVESYNISNDATLNNVYETFLVNKEDVYNFTLYDRGKGNQTDMESYYNISSNTTLYNPNETAFVNEDVYNSVVQDKESISADKEIFNATWIKNNKEERSHGHNNLLTNGEEIYTTTQKPTIKRKNCVKHGGNCLDLRKVKKHLYTLKFLPCCGKSACRAYKSHPILRTPDVYRCFADKNLYNQIYAKIITY
uniref:Uncharacterized protein n=1 Tax=Clastoptera arizonana TaxID=38151 RepID=A0A1B6DTH6_9HEMI